MYSRQNRNPREEVAIELPRDYGGSAFYPFPTHQDEHRRNSPRVPREEEKRDECVEKEKPCEERESCREERCEKCGESEECCTAESIPCRPSGILPGLSGLLGGNIGLEELLLLGVIFLIFSDNDLRDNELIICLLLILFI